METRTEVNYQIDWKSDTPAAFHDRTQYLKMLRGLVRELDALGNPEVSKVFQRYSVHLVDIDDIKRVNLDWPIVSPAPAS